MGSISYVNKNYYDNKYKNFNNVYIRYDYYKNSPIVIVYDVTNNNEEDKYKLIPILIIDKENKSILIQNRLINPLIVVIIHLLSTNGYNISISNQYGFDVMNLD